MPASHRRCCACLGLQAWASRGPFVYRVRARDARIRVMHAIAITPQLCNPPQLNTTMSIEDALTEIASLGPEEEICYARIAQKHGVVQSTLSRQHQAITQSATTKNINQQKLTPQQEEELVQYIQEHAITDLRRMFRTGRWSAPWQAPRCARQESSPCGFLFVHWKEVS
jgi:transposase-like protein